jgi:glycolate oxidase FAD binding subunit
MSVLMPASAAELADLLARAAREQFAVVSGTNQRVPPAASTLAISRLDPSRLNKILEHDVADQVIKVQSGIPISKLQNELAGKRQFLPVRVPKDWCLLDVIERAETGALEHGFGGARELILGVEAVTGRGITINAGGRVVKNVTGYDVTKLLVGSRSWLALPVAVYLRLYALPETSGTLCWTFDSPWKLTTAVNALYRSGIPFAALEYTQNDLLQIGRGRLLLLAQIMTLNTVREELLDQAQKLIGPAEELLTSGEEDQLWSYLTKAFLGSDCAQTVSVAAAPSVIPDAASRISAHCRWLARPIKGKLYAVTPEPLAVIDELRRLSIETGQTMAAAHADNSYNYKIEYMPSDDSARRRIKQRIKDKFDPDGVLNPFVVV